MTVNGELVGERLEIVGWNFTSKDADGQNEINDVVKVLRQVAQEWCVSPLAAPLALGAQ